MLASRERRRSASCPRPVSAMIVVEVPSGIERILAAASSPLSSGMLISMNTTVGRTWRNLSKASRGP